MSARTVRRLSFWTIIVGIAVLGVKLLSWWLTGSVALLSDAMESIVNVAASLMVFYAIRVAARPADENHPFGHFKAEYISAVVEGILILLAAVLIAREAVMAFAMPRTLEAPALGLALNVVASIANGAWGFILMRYGRRARSPALVADGRHLWTDVITSVGVVFGLLLALATGWLWLDPLIAIIVAISIVFHGSKIVMSSIHGLMDAAMEPDDRALVERIIGEAGEGALEFHDLKTREAGRARFIEFHLVVPSEMTVEESHEICDRIEDALEDALPGARVTIHVEPAHKAKHM
jgi:cation diffusion facilitator family transporter